MSDRMCINDIQLFGNNEIYPEWIEFLKSKGFKIDEENHYEEQEFDDFMGALITLEKIVERLSDEQDKRIEKDKPYVEKFLKEHPENKNEINEIGFSTKRLGDFSNIVDKCKKETKEGERYYTLFDQEIQLMNNAYLLLPLTFFNIVKDDLEPMTFSSMTKEEKEKYKNRFYCYKLKEGKTIRTKFW